MSDETKQHTPQPVGTFTTNRGRFVVCRLCGVTLPVTSWPDDTRWRYPSHADGGPDDERCDNSHELINPK